MVFTPLNILLIEDNPGDARLFHEMLKEVDSVGSTIELADNLSSGVDLLQQNEYDVTLLDLGLPESSGVKTLQSLLEKVPNPGPIVVLTGLEDEDVGMAAVQMGAQDYLQKSSLTAAILSRSLHYAIERNRTNAMLKLQGTALQAAANAIVITDSQGIIEWANPAYSQLTGNSFEDIVGQKHWLLTDDGKDAANNDELRQTIMRGEVWRGELENRRKDGTSYTLEITITPVMNGDGPPSNFIAVKHDITHRKKAEADLHSANERLQSLNQVMAIAATSLEPETVLQKTSEYLGGILDISQGRAVLLDRENDKATLCASYGVDPELAALGQEFSYVTTPLYEKTRAQKEFMVVRDAMNSPLLLPFRHLFRNVDVETMVIVPLFVQEKLAGVIAFVSSEPLEITHEEGVLINAATRFISQALENCLLHKEVAKQNMQLADLVTERTDQLEILNNRTSTIVNNVSDAILLLGPNHIILSANRAFERIFGYAVHEVLGRSILDFFDEEDGALLQEQIDSLNAETQYAQLEVFGHAKNDNEFDAGVALAQVANGHKQTVCSVRDISHLKEAERLKDQFVSTVNHELRTPIAAISLLSDGTNRHYARMTDEQRLEKVGLIHQQAQVLNELIEGILNMAQLDSKKEYQEQEEVNFGDTFHAVVNEVQSSVEAKGQVLKVFSGEESPTVAGTDDSLRLIWRNLISNAHKYTHEGGFIEARWGTVRKSHEGSVTVESSLKSKDISLPDNLVPGEYIVGQVNDTGNGIPEKDLEHIYSRFYRGWAHNSNISGNGIGLAIVHELIERLGGEITVESTVGEGTAFTFWIPAVLKQKAKEEQSQEPVTQEKQTQEQKAEEQILVEQTADRLKVCHEKVNQEEVAAR